MGTINQFDKTACRVVSEAAERALQEVAKQFGLKVERRAGSYTELAFTAKFEFTATARDGKTSAQVEFEKYCSLYDLKPEDFGQIIHTGQGDHRIAGLAMKRSKYPIVCEAVKDGVKRMFHASVVNTYHRQQAAAGKAVQS